MGTVYTFGDPTPRTLLAVRQCATCKRAEDLADKRRAVLSRNTRDR
jgi:hypothetical protein